MKDYKKILELSIIIVFFLIVGIFWGVNIGERKATEQEEIYTCYVNIVGVDDEWFYDVVDYKFKNHFWTNRDELWITLQNDDEIYIDASYIQYTCIEENEGG